MAFSVGNFTSEFDVKVPSVLLFAAFSLVASAAVALVTSVDKLAAMVFSDPVALVTSDAKLVVKVVSAPVALVTSVARSDVKVASAAALVAASAAIAALDADALAST